MFWWFILSDRIIDRSSLARGVLDKLLHSSSASSHHLLGSPGHVLLRTVCNGPRLWPRFILGIPTAQWHRWYCVPRISHGTVLPVEAQSSQPSQEYWKHRQRRSLLPRTTVTTACQSSSPSWIRSWHWMVHLPRNRVCALHWHLVLPYLWHSAEVNQYWRHLNMLQYAAF